MLISKLFGFEESILLTKCAGSEVARYKFFGIWFILLVVAILFSTFIFFELLSGDLLVALLGAFVLTYMLFSVLRFTLISISVSKIREPNERFLTITNGIRLFFFSFLVFLISIPITEFVNRDVFEEKLENYKNQSFQAFKEGLMVQINQKTAELTKEIKTQQKAYQQSIVNYQLENTDLIEKGVRLFEVNRFQKRILKLQQKLKETKTLLAKEANLKATNYQDEIALATLPFVRYGFLFDDKKSVLMITFIFILFSSILPYYSYSIFKKGNKYQLEFVELNRSKIIDDYKTTNRAIESLFQKKYQITYHKNELFEDAPFNTKPISTTSVKVEGKDLFDYFSVSTKSI